VAIGEATNRLVQGYFECQDRGELLARARHFAPELGDGDEAELAAALAASTPPPAADV